MSNVEINWDDGKHAKVNKVVITYEKKESPSPYFVIWSIQVTYEGSPESPIRGSLGPQSGEFTLGPDEYITALTAESKRLSSSSEQRVVTRLTFTTNKLTIHDYGIDGTRAIICKKKVGLQIAGFKGTSSNVLNSIDVHHAPVPAAAWDDGEHTKVNEVKITYDDVVIHSIQVTYEGSLQYPLRGSLGPISAVFTLETDEYITALSAYVETLSSPKRITGLTFTTNKDDPSSSTKKKKTYGRKTKFLLSALEATGQQIAGFHGISSNVLNFINVHYAPGPPKKLKAAGGETGAVWDDGAHDNVKKVYVGQGNDGISFVKFEYVDGSQVVTGAEHGKKSFLGVEEFAFDSDEYITSVEGTYDNIFGPNAAVVSMLMFKTNKNKNAGPFGIEGSTPFIFKDEHYKIVGFHGRVGESLNAIGAHLAHVGPMSPIPVDPATPA